MWYSYLFFNETNIHLLFLHFLVLLFIEYDVKNIMFPIALWKTIIEPWNKIYSRKFTFSSDISMKPFNQTQ